MKGPFQCRCSRCGLEKGSRDSNAGWWEMKPRGNDLHTTHWFCPSCAPRLLVAADGALEGGLPLADGVARPPEHRVVAVSLLQWIAAFTLRFPAPRLPARGGAELNHEARQIFRVLRPLLPFSAREPSELAAAADAEPALSRTPQPNAERADDSSLDGGAKHEWTGDRK